MLSGARQGRSASSQSFIATTGEKCLHNTVFIYFSILPFLLGSKEKRKKKNEDVFKRSSMNKEIIFEKNIFEDEKEHLVADEDDAPQISRSNQFIEVKLVDTNST